MKIRGKCRYGTYARAARESFTLSCVGNQFVLPTFLGKFGDKNRNRPRE